jgi:hypothetical protein
VTPVAPGAGRLILRTTMSGVRKLTLKLKQLGNTPLSAFGNPLFTGATDYDVCVFDRSGPAGAPALKLTARAPAGGVCGRKSCWTPSGVGLRYTDRDAPPDGLVSMKLSPGDDGVASILATGKGSHLLLPTGALIPGVTLQIRRDDAISFCWEADFAGNVRANVAGKFDAKSD